MANALGVSRNPLLALTRERKKQIRTKNNNITLLIKPTDTPSLSCRSPEGSRDPELKQVDFPGRSRGEAEWCTGPQRALSLARPFDPSFCPRSPYGAGLACGKPRHLKPPRARHLTRSSLSLSTTSTPDSTPSATLSYTMARTTFPKPDPRLKRPAGCPMNRQTMTSLPQGPRPLARPNPPARCTVLRPPRPCRVRPKVQRPEGNDSAPQCARMYPANKLPRPSRSRRIRVASRLGGR
ncbi:hypothetical protein FRC08_007874 [Ceratobasidium sp. 394]|nr:hypothetical protein FRC08_007874 [Ceratobasidium sp. 394]